MSLSHVTIDVPKPNTIPYDNTPWILPGVDDTPRPNQYGETFTEACKLVVLATNVMDVV